MQRSVGLTENTVLNCWEIFRAEHCALYAQTRPKNTAPHQDNVQPEKKEKKKSREVNRQSRSFPPKKKPRTEEKLKHTRGGAWGEKNH